MRSARTIRWNGPGLAALVHQDGRDVVLQVAADARAADARADAVRRQLLRVADARQHQQLRAVDHAAGQDDLRHRPRRSGPFPLSFMIVDADRARALEQHAGDHGADRDRQARPGQHRPEIGGRRTAAPAVADGHLQPAEAFLAGAVVFTIR